MSDDSDLSDLLFNIYPLRRERERDTVGTRILFFENEKLYIAIVLKHLEMERNIDNETELKRLKFVFSLHHLFLHISGLVWKATYN